MNPVDASAAPVFLFPGQGSQTPGMGADFYAESTAARAVFDRAEPVLPPNFFKTLFEGSDDEVRDTRIAQPALVLVGAAIAAHLNSQSIHASAAAGHSVGEIAALHVAGALDLEAALSLTCERARLMAEESPEGTMAAVLGLDPDAIAAALPDRVDVANYNSPVQTIISGPVDVIEQAVTQLKAAGAKRVLPLPVSGPFHSWCMKAAAEKFRDHVRNIAIASPKVRFVSSVSGREENDPERIRELLWQQLYSPVRWVDVMKTLGPCDALEVGPGSVLAGLAKRTENAPVIRAAGTMNTISAESASGGVDRHGQV